MGILPGPLPGASTFLDNLTCNLLQLVGIIINSANTHEWLPDVPGRIHHLGCNEKNLVNSIFVVLYSGVKLGGLFSRHAKSLQHM